MRAFLVRLPSSVRYWTVVDDCYRVVCVADEYLQHLRLGRDAAESTTKSYAEALALYLRWCEQGSRDWRTAGERLGGFITWLRHTPGDPDAPLAGPGAGDVRGPGRINRTLSAVRGFLRHGVVTGEVPAAVLAVLYDITDEEVFRASGIGRTDDSEALRTRVGQLEQQVLDLRQELGERTDDLDAARAANRDLMTLANRNCPVSVKVARRGVATWPDYLE